jgi:hypothetical protein
MEKCNKLIDEFIPLIIPKSEIHSLFDRALEES